MSHGRVWHAVEKKTKDATLGSGRGSTIVGDHMGRPAHGKARCCVFCFCMRQRRWRPTFWINDHTLHGNWTKKIWPTNVSTKTT